MAKQDAGPFNGHYYFKVLPDGTVDEKKAFCRHCHAAFCYERGSPALKSHLMARHAADAGLALERDDLTGAVAKWLATDCRPVSIVDDIGLRNVFRIAAEKRGHEFPSRERVSRRLRQLYRERDGRSAEEPPPRRPRRADVSSKKRKLLSDSSSSGDEEPAPLFAPAKDSNGEQSFNLKPRDQAPEVEEEKEQGCDLDAAAFWRCCNTAGCTDAILGNFLADMEDVSLRIRQERASRQDLDLALRVMMSSGKLAQLLRKEQKELEQKETVAQKSLAAMREAISLLSARRASGDFAASKVSAESGE